MTFKFNIDPKKWLRWLVGIFLLVAVALSVVKFAIAITIDAVLVFAVATVGVYVLFGLPGRRAK